MIKPKTKYSKSGRVNIAYQVIGNGPLDLVYIPGWVSNIDLMWECPQLARFLLELSEVARVILFDKRGTGLSDRISELSTLEERMDDIRAVMDSVHSERAVLFGHSEGGSVSALFAATYPSRTISLITFGVFAKRRYSANYPWAPTDEEREKVYEMITSSWGSRDMYLESLAPSLAQDKTFMNWLAKYFRSGASPSAALVLTKMNTRVDIIDILETIEVPTLLMYRTNDIDVKIEEGRFIAKRIKNSKYVEFPGQDHLFWAGDATSVLEEMITFIKQSPKAPFINRALATILKIKICQVSLQSQYLKSKNIEDLKTSIDQVINTRVKQYLGDVIDCNSGIYTATFDGPSKAIHCAVDIKNSIQTYQIDLLQGVHIGECITNERGEIKGQAVTIAEQIMLATPSGEINASSTVINLLSGTGLDFEYDQHLQVEENKVMQVLRLINPYAADTNIKSSTPQSSPLISSKINHSILEEVILHIETNLSNENYSLTDLCQDLGVNPRQLQRKLKTITNKTPNQLIRSVRLYKAKELLLKDSKSVKEIAYKTGFGSLSYFSKAFKKEFDMLPSQLK